VQDRSGAISRKELREALTTAPLDLGWHAGTIDAIIDRADADKNGRIDFLEFSQVVALS